MSFKSWWRDDWHIIPRWTRDLIAWCKGRRDTRVDLTVVTYDETTDCLHFDTVRRPLKEVDDEGLHETNKGFKSFFLMKDGPCEWPLPGRVTAHDLYLWAESDAIDAAANKKKASWLEAIDAKIFAIVGILVALVVVVYMVIL